MLIDLKGYYDEHGKKATQHLLHNNMVVVTEKIQGYRVYCKKEKFGNVLFYSKKKSQPINVLDRIVSDLYEPFINHILKRKEMLEVGEYSFYLTNNNDLILTNTSFKDDKPLTLLEPLKVTIATPLYKGLLMDKTINHIIAYLSGDGGDLRNIFPYRLPENIVEGFVFNLYDKGSYKLIDKNIKQVEYPKVNTSVFELLLIDIFDFIKNQDFSNVKFTTKNKDLKKAEFAFEMFNRFVEYHKHDLENFIIEYPSFLRGRLNKRYICNETTMTLIQTDPRLEYLLQIFINAIKNRQKPRGLITEELSVEYNQVINKISEYIIKNEDLLDFNTYKKFSKNE